jgi:hypothetical protein
MKWLVFITIALLTTPCYYVEKEVKCIDDVIPIDKFKNWSINDKPQSEWTDVDWLAKMMMSEVYDSIEIEAIYLVGITAKNHSIIDKTTITKAILRPGSFSGVNLPSYIWWRAEPTEMHKRLALRIIAEDVPQHLKKLFAFCNLKLLSPKTKAWFLSFKVYKNIKDVTFFVNEKL